MSRASPRRPDAVFASLGGVLTVCVCVGSPALAQVGLVARLEVERAISSLEGAHDPAERRLAARFLGLHGDPERAAAALALAIVVEPDRDVRIEIADAIARLRTPLGSPAMRERMSSAPAEERRALLRALGAAADAGALEALALEIGALQDGALAVDLLVLCGGDARPVLEAALRDATRVGPALEALARIGDPASAPAVAELLTAEHASVRAGAARALTILGDPNGVLGPYVAADDLLLEVVLRTLSQLDREPPARTLVELAEARVRAPEPSLRAAALAFLAAFAPDTSVGALTLGLDDAPEVRAAVRDALERSDAPPLVDVARALLMHSEPGTEAHDVATDFLVRARDGSGLLALVELGAPPLALALALRRAPDAEAAGRAIEALRSTTPTAGHALLMALAGIGPAPALDSASAPERALAAAAVWLSVDCDASALALALATESDDGVFAWQTRAALAHGLALAAGPLRAWLERPSRRADALALVPAALERATGADARALRSALSLALRSDDPRERATAAQALGAVGASETSATLERLLADESITVRVAAARALFALDSTRAHLVVSAEARAAHDTASAVALLDALKPTDAPDILVVQVEVLGETAEPWMELRSCDGTWLRLPVLPGGLVVVPDVPCSTVDADLVIEPR